MKAILIGVTGATGSDLLQQLLADEAFTEIIAFSRRPLEVTDIKLAVHVFDFNAPNSWQHLVQGDVLFSCLGTTLKAAGSKEAQWKIDYDYAYAFAKAAKENGVPHLVLVSSAGANPKSRLFYPRMKGILENDLITLGFKQLSIYRPPLLLRKNSDRNMEIISSKVLAALNKIGILKAQKPLETKLLAASMILQAKYNKAGLKIFGPEDIRQLIKSAGNLS